MSNGFRRPGVDRAALHKLLDDLLDLRERTAPATCVEPATVPVVDPPPKTMNLGGTTVEVVEVIRGKDGCADWALMRAQELLLAVAHWAVCHKVGRLMNAASDPNSHDHEILSSQPEAVRNFIENSSVNHRNIIREIIKPLSHRNYFFFNESRSGGVCFFDIGDFAQDLDYGLRALNYGECLSPLVPEKTAARGSPFRMNQLRLRAVQQVYILHGAGSTKRSARERIAQAFGRSDDAIRKWESTLLPEFFGKSNFTAAINEAKEIGATCKNLIMKHSSIEAALTHMLNSTPLLGPEYFAAVMHNEDMRDLGAEHNRLERESASGNQWGT